MQNRHHPLAPHQPFSKTALSLAPHQPFQSRTITIAFRRGASLLLPLHRILPFPQSSQKYNHPLLRTIALASLVKGRWIDGKAHTVALLLSACDMPTLFILHTFLPSRRRDCSAICTINEIFRTIPRPAPALPKPHYPSKTANTLASLVKGRWIDDKTQTIALFLSACDTPTLFILQTFLPSRRRDCFTPTNPSKTALSLENRQHPCIFMNAQLALRPCLVSH